MTKSRPILIGNSVLAALQVLAGGAVLQEAIGPVAGGMFVLIVAALQFGFNTYVQGLVVPTQDVAAYVNGAGTAVAGPAAPIMTGTPVRVDQAPTKTQG